MRKTRAEKIRKSLRQNQQFQAPTFEFVKREFSIREATEAKQAPIHKRPVDSNQTAILASTKNDLLKTFILASAILSLEAVLYFFWQ